MAVIFTRQDECKDLEADTHVELTKQETWNLAMSLLEMLRTGNPNKRVFMKHNNQKNYLVIWCNKELKD